jgi:hypothetical protein
VSDGYISAERVVAVARQHAYNSATIQRPDEDVTAELVDARRLETEARELAAGCEQFGPALSAILGGLPVVPLTADGSEPIAAPMRQLGDVIAYWTDHPTVPAGMPTGREFDLLAASFDEAGYLRLIELATPIPPSRESGFFGGTLPHMLDHGGGAIQLIEKRPAASGPIMRTAFVFNQDPEQAAKAVEWAESAKVEVRGLALAWHWPSGDWDRLDPKRVARGTHILPAVPLPDAVVERSGKQWLVTTTAMRNWGPAPAWVASSVLGGKVRVPA